MRTSLSVLIALRKTGGYVAGTKIRSELFFIMKINYIPDEMGNQNYCLQSLGWLY